MLTYKNLYCSLVRSMSEAIDLYDEGKGILAREGLKKALLPDYPQGVCHIRKAAELPTAVQCAARAVLQDKNCQCAGSRGKAPCVLLGDLKGAILSRERMAPFAAPLRVRREKHAALPRCITRSGTLPQPPHPRSDTAARPWRKTSHFPRRIRRSSADATLSRLRFRHSPASRSS